MLSVSDNSIRGRVLIPPGPTTWSSLNTIRPCQTDYFQRVLGFDLDFEVCTSSFKRKSKDDLWIFPIGAVQWPVLNWLRQNFKKPSDRPPILFFLNGEGVKLGFHLLSYSGIFRDDDQWIVNCYPEKEILDWIFQDNSRTHVMFLPVSKPVKKRTKQRSIRKEFNISAKKTLYLYAGRISLQKNILSLIDFISSKSKAHLLICGDTDSIGLPHFKGTQSESIANQILNKLLVEELTDRVTILPHQTQEQLHRIMSESDIQISLSSHYGEDFGYSICQGLYHQLPTLLSAWGGHLNWKNIESADVGFVDLNWDSRKHGRPKDFKFVGQGKNNQNFIEDYENFVDLQLKNILESVMSEPASNQVRVRPEVLKFWTQKSLRKEPFLFRTENDHLFRRVRDFYEMKLPGK